MAKKADEKVIVKIKPDNKQKIIVSRGRQMGTPIIPFEILKIENVPSAAIAKERVKELLTEYKDVDGLSVNYFSV